MSARSSSPPLRATSPNDDGLRLRTTGRHDTNEEMDAHEKAPLLSMHGLRQQSLRAWQPLLTPNVMIPVLALLGLIFVPLGAFLWIDGHRVFELAIDYTMCRQMAPTTSFAPLPPMRLATVRGAARGTNPLVRWKRDLVQGRVQCTLEFTLPRTLKPPVFMYYRLTNFYQNHRRYSRSFSDKQLRGEPVHPEGIDIACRPYGRVAPHSEAVYYPCGLIANTFFNDTISDLTEVATNITYEFTERGIAWPSDHRKYAPLRGFDPDLHVPPPNWVATYGDRYAEMPDLATNERFQVWMRTSGLPNFYKLYGRNDSEPLERGTYRVVITDNYNVADIKGTKSLAISTSAMLGGYNPYLGALYMGTGTICLALAAIFWMRHRTNPRALGDHRYLSWVQAMGGTAGAPPSKPS
ncbi:hypothetical protein AMAG_09080 [Allomyces macrogynus ATCC 38327]|uniref:Uncharacterized protein n=1 Tax=Allomyces macrogynus (strain ATCC 38327) TaxID=578462 RepID=A0A0L0SNF3_ALLM3|nr:hypothetical protein AMAG_09080 [Allomyces macrogynus ATCC 38327]|eukprot:KNE64022.1 hypothetical protein AMAG_09080 [Allomyces macrogynus ATCC 38327]